MKRSTIRAFVLAIGVLVGARFLPGVASGVMIATATGNNSGSSSTTSGNNTTGGQTTTSGNNTTGGQTSGSGSSTVNNQQTPITPDDVVVSVDWSAVSTNISTALQEGEDRNVRISAGTQYALPTNILDTLAQSNKVLMLHAGNGYALSVSSEDVRRGSELKIDMSTSANISEKANAQVANAAAKRTFALKNDSVLPFKVDIHVTIGSQYAGKTAVLYRYDASTDSLKAVGVFTVTNGGNAMFALRSNGEYMVAVVDEVPQLAGSYKVASGDTLSSIAKKLGVSLNSLIQANPQLTNPNNIKVGQVLNIL